MQLKRIAHEIEGAYLYQGSTMHDLGLFRGKLGMCIYLYIQARNTGCERHREKADELVEQCVDEVRNSLNYSFESGMTGIGAGFIYLVENGFIEADLDEFLEEFDSKVYHELHFNLIENQRDSVKTLCDFLIYYTYRVKTRNNEDESEISFLLKQSIVTIINQMDKRISNSSQIFEEPSGFQLFWSLPLLLLLLSEVHKLGIYRYKIERILNEIANTVLSIFPRQHSHRLSLAYSIKAILSEISLPSWSSHMNLLVSSIDCKNLLNSELRDKQLFFEDGLVGVYMILEQWNKLSNKSIDLSIKDEVKRKIENSALWEDSRIFDSPESSIYNGLTGMLGVNLLITQLIKK